MPLTFTVDFSGYSSPEHLEDCILSEQRMAEMEERHQEELARAEELVMRLKEEAALRESFISGEMDQKVCPRCQMARRGWYNADGW